MKFGVYLLSSLLLLACNNPEESTQDKLDNYTAKYYRITEASSNFPGLELDGLVTFYKDGSLTMINKNGEYTEGSQDAQLDKSSLFLLDNSYEFTRIQNEETLLLKNENGEIHLKENYKLHLEDIDLLSSERNWWRLKPEHQETDKEVEHRVVGHLVYLLDYFKMLESSEAKTFSTQYLNLPLKLYSNGLALTSYSKLPDTWKATFYDEENALYAYKTLAQALKSIKKYPKDDKSHVKSFIKALELMILYIEA